MEPLYIFKEKTKIPILSEALIPRKLTNFHHFCFDHIQNSYRKCSTFCLNENMYYLHVKTEKNVFFPIFLMKKPKSLF